MSAAHETRDRQDPDILQSEVAAITGTILNDAFLDWKSTNLTASRAITALKEGRFEDFDLIVFHMSEGGSHSLARFKTLAHQVDSAIQKELKLARGIKDEGHILNAFSIANSALKAGLNYDHGKHQPKTTETLIVAGHQAGRYLESLDLVDLAFQCKLNLSVKTSLHSISAFSRLGFKDSATLTVLGKVALGLLDRKIPEQQVHMVANSYNILLAYLAAPEFQPKNTGERATGDKSILDIAHRAAIAVPIAEKLILAGVPFDSERLEGRFNMTIRGTTTIVQALKEIVAACENPATDSAFITLTSLTGQKFRQHLPEADSPESERVRQLAQELSIAALGLANQMIVRSTDTGVLEIAGNGRFEGSTVNAVIQALYDSEVQLSHLEVQSLKELVSNALELPELKKKLHSKYLQMAVDCMLESETEDALATVLQVVSQGINAGFNFDRSKTKRIAEYARGQNYERKWYRDELRTLIQYNRQDIKFNSANTAKIPGNVQPSTDTGLRGGIGEGSAGGGLFGSLFDLPTREEKPGEE